MRPRSSVERAFVARGELVPLLVDHWVERNHITALWSESRKGNPNVRAFVAFFARTLSRSGAMGGDCGRNLTR
ncbi:hypothetical protein [Rhizobium leguminosarum]|uniref:DNA-binding transcriptional LysR family regulator n=1 Tax=Rhizobium leguminosarum TaxID=384 RepID=A0A7X0DQK3_RHILE|nr:hypothetical protein [Rhizobium leguminosarum]MBB6219385.1 DNA-binding transcriptional LysR family regulator [Rhizobium leguminosarum]